MTTTSPDPEPAPTKPSTGGCKPIGVGCVVLLVIAGLGMFVMARMGGGNSGKNTTAGFNEDNPCIAAFGKAASKGDMEDSVADLIPAAFACRTVDEWITGNRAHKAIDGDPVESLVNICSGSKQMLKAPACIEVVKLYPDLIYDKPYVAPSP